MSAGALAERARRLLPGLWLGGLLMLGAGVAPASFELLARGDAGRLNGALFVREAWASIALALLLWWPERARARRAAAAGQGSVLSAEMALLLAVLLVTLVSRFGVMDMMEAARAGRPTMLGFGALHGVSLALYALKLVLVASLAWRAAASPAAAVPTSSP